MKTNKEFVTMATLIIGLTCSVVGIALCDVLWIKYTVAGAMALWMYNDISKEKGNRHETKTKKEERLTTSHGSPLPKQNATPLNQPLLGRDDRV